MKLRSSAETRKRTASLKNQTETSNKCTQNVFIIFNLENVVNTLYARTSFDFLRYVEWLSNIGHICKICKKDGRLFTTRSFTYSRENTNRIIKTCFVSSFLTFKDEKNNMDSLASATIITILFYIQCSQIWAELEKPGFKALTRGIIESIILIA